MKRILLVLFTCTLTSVFSQQQFQCYHVQEFEWNPQTHLHDSPIEKNDASIFIFNEANKTIQQVFGDGSKAELTAQSVSHDGKTNTTSYKVKSPTNGLNYTYVINDKSSLIEVSLNETGKNTLLKKYLYKN
ncbi:MAG: hypothetical protein K0R26_2267 [Bacteroidota bacterium]|jgi:hypothetical protein|nr:hypothetical protein [Bacteroidota bacterium]